MRRKKSWHSESEEEQEDDCEEDEEFTPSQKSAAKRKPHVKRKSPAKRARRPKKSRDDWLVNNEKDWGSPRIAQMRRNGKARTMKAKKIWRNGKGMITVTTKILLLLANQHPNEKSLQTEKSL